MPLDGEKFKGPDPRPAKRVKNPKAMKQVHEQGCFCVLCGEKGTIHHLVPRSQGGGDEIDNLVCLDGSGTTGCHGKVENHDRHTRIALRAELTEAQERYIISHKSQEWLDTYYPKA